MSVDERFGKTYPFPPLYVNDAFFAAANAGSPRSHSFAVQFFPRRASLTSSVFPARGLKATCGAARSSWRRLPRAAPRSMQETSFNPIGEQVSWNTFFGAPRMPPSIGGDLKTSTGNGVERLCAHRFCEQTRSALESAFLRAQTRSLIKQVAIGAGRRRHIGRTAMLPPISRCRIG
jgi:hypothetical protein